MQTIQRSNSSRWTFVIYVGLVLFGIAVGVSFGEPQTADAEVRKGKEQVTFQSGGARSEKILKEIAGIVARMDGRMAKIEGILVKASGNKSR